MKEEGFNTFDGTTIAFTDVPASYYVGTDQRTAMGQNGWPLVGSVAGVDYPIDSERVTFVATEDVYIYWYPLDMIFAIANAQLSGTPVAGYYLADTPYDLPIKTALIVVVRAAAINGNLHINFHA